MKHLLLLFLILNVPLFAQQRYLVSSKDEIIPLKRSESTSQALQQRLRNQPSSPSNASLICGSKFTFGYDGGGASNSNFGGTHKDVMAEWFVVPVSGTIDALYWDILGSVGALDSTVYISIYKSRIGPSYGAGANGSNPFNAPCQQWGYYKNTNDYDRGISPYIETATDTNWVSTITGSLGGAITQSPTIGEAIWGGVLGVPHIMHLNVYHDHISMLEYDTLNVTAGDVIWVSQRIKSPPGHTNDSRTEFDVGGFRTTLDDENYPSRAWKFYEHDSGPSNCAGVPQNDAKRGWVARGGFGDDSLDVVVFQWLYEITVTSNVPPFIQSETVLHNTFDTAPYPVEAEIEDCDPPNPGYAGVAAAAIRWSVNNIQQPDISMNFIGGTTWHGTIPAQPVGSTITYKVTATDSGGLMGSGLSHTFNVLELSNAFYFAETSASCVTHDISATGTAIPNGSFFLPPTAPSNALATDDGTAGPFALGCDMWTFGEENHYIWVGVNGAIALSKYATDTLDVNSNGDFDSDWSFPFLNALRTGRDTNATVMSRMPINFIAPIWSDLILADTLGNQFGHILYEKAPAGDTCVFVVQYDSIGIRIPPYYCLEGCPDESKFRIVLNLCDGTIEFQYDNIGYLGIDTMDVTGMQGQTNAEYISLNQDGYPVETRPRNNWCVRFYPGTAMIGLDSWNMVSVPVIPYNGDYSRQSLFPNSVGGSCFGYLNAYSSAETLENGRGYWLKFRGAGTQVGPRGRLLRQLTININNSWNIIGSIGYPVAPSGIGVTGGAVVSNFFGYGLAGYSIPSTIVPGYGYWVKMNGSGSLTLSHPCTTSAQNPMLASPTVELSRLNTITIVDASGRQQSLYIGNEDMVHQPLSFYELPPAAPGFDARYASGRIVETYPACLEKNGVYEYPISFNEASYPLTIRWDIVKPASNSLVLTSTDGKLGNTVMNGTGSIKITDANVKSIVVKLADIKVPTKYALGQNYPNPFNPTTRFEIAIPKTAFVTVTIYDVLGRQITTLMNGRQGAGYYTMEWDARDARGLNVPTGIYFIRMTSRQEGGYADEFDQTQKIILMK
jgi:hypothetical protein